MAVSKPEIIEGARIVERGGQVVELDRVYHFSDLDFSTDEGAKVLTDALENAPPTGSVHPSYDSTGANVLMLEDRFVEPVGHNQARMVLTYRWNPTTLQIIDAGAGIESVITELDSPEKDSAQPIVLTHPALPPDTTGTRQQGAQVNVTTARPFAIGVVSLGVTGIVQVMNHINTYVNTINSDNFLGGDPKTWLVTDGSFQVAARGTNGVVSVARFTFTFQYKPEFWQPIKVVAIRPLDGLPFPDAGSTGAPGAKVDLNWYTEIAFSGIQAV